MSDTTQRPRPRVRWEPVDGGLDAVWRDVWLGLFADTREDAERVRAKLQREGFAVDPVPEVWP